MHALEDTASLTIIKALLPLLLLSFAGCKRYYLEVAQQIVNREYLASSYIGSPDPLLCHPPYGRQLIVSWQVPKEVLAQNPHIELRVITWDYHEERISYPITSQRGYELYTLVNKEFEQTGGILTYKADLITQEGCVFRTWKHQLWVDLITIEEQPYLPPPEPDFPKPAAL